MRKILLYLITELLRKRIKHPFCHCEVDKGDRGNLGFMRKRRGLLRRYAPRNDTLGPFRKSSVITCLVAVIAIGATPDELVKQLGSVNWEEREKASDELIAIGLPAKTSIENALSSSDAEVRARAQQIKTLLQWKEAFSSRLDRFINQLRKGAITEPNLMRDVVVFISREESAPYLMTELIKNPAQPVAVKQQVAYELSNVYQSGFNKIIPDLIEVFKKETDETLRSYLVRIFGKCGADERTFPEVLTCLKLPSAAIKVAAINALSEIGDNSAVPELFKILKGADTNIKSTALYALARFQNEQTRTELMKFIKEEPQGSLRAQAVGILANQPDPKLIPELLELMKTEKEPDVLRNILYALQRHPGNKTIAPALVQLAKTVPPALQANLLAALQVLGDRSIMPQMIAMLEQENDYAAFNTVLNTVQALAGGQKFMPQAIPPALKQEVLTKTKEWYDKNK
ncbi:MAG: HEAT repeat domain-containing protein [Planctomycetes bacterium]|nr:HEAT repeat domain-containing protein [Planctomycetota bacterium]